MGNALVRLVIVAAACACGVLSLHAILSGDVERSLVLLAVGVLLLVLNVEAGR